jgi:hypothetical protein
MMMTSIALSDARRKDMTRAQSSWIGLARLARAKYLSIEIPAFVVGFLSSGSHSLSYLALGNFAIVLFLLVTSYSNTLSDRVEDAIDYPERTRLAQLVGYGRIFKAMVIAIALYPVAIILMIWPGGMRPYWAAGWILVLTLTAGYSLGPKLKTKKLISPLITGGTAAGFLLLGYFGTNLNGNDGGLLASFLLLWIFGISLYMVGYKDLANIAGDTTIGFRSTYWDVISGRRPAVRAGMLLILPYLTMIILVGVGLLSPVVLVALVLIPACAGYGIAMAKGRGPAEGIAIRDIGNIYWQLFVAVVLFGLHPRAATLLIALFALAWYLVSSFALHHDPPPLHGDKLKALYGAVKARGL